MRFGHIPGSSDALRVLHLTDPHLFADKDGALRGVVTYSSLRRVLTHYQAANWQADVVALTGDIIHDDSAAAYVHCRELLEALNLPVYCLPGTHDVRSLMRDELGEAPFNYCGSGEHGNWLLVSVDSCAAGRAGGIIGDEEMRRVEQVVSGSNAPHVLVCLHHPPVPMHSAWLDTVGLENGARFLERLQALGRIRAVIFGHVHQEYDAVHGGIRVIATPSTCRQFLPNADEFAVDDKPPAYRRVALNADGTLDAELIWVDDD